MSRHHRYTARDNRLARICKERAGWKCEKCGAPGPRLAAHHKIPLHRNGPRELSNLECVCAICHEAMHPERHKRRWSRLVAATERAMLR